MLMSPKGELFSFARKSFSASGKLAIACGAAILVSAPNDAALSSDYSSLDTIIFKGGAALRSEVAPALAKGCGALAMVGAVAGFGARAIARSKSVPDLMSW